tara:strand:- start:1245 stop:1511 length:267 start_codon:yes stop_codon:yes gene_type:complete
MIFLVVNIEEIVPVTIAIKLIPKNIIITARILPLSEVGYISPYPTVVMVTIVHHRELLKLLNVSGSIIEIIIAPKNQVMISPNTTIKR